MFTALAHFFIEKLWILSNCHLLLKDFVKAITIIPFWITGKITNWGGTKEALKNRNSYLATVNNFFKLHCTTPMVCHLTTKILDKRRCMSNCTVRSLPEQEVSSHLGSFCLLVWEIINARDFPNRNVNEVMINFSFVPFCRPWCKTLRFL